MDSHMLKTLLQLLTILSLAVLYLQLKREYIKTCIIGHHFIRFREDMGIVHREELFLKEINWYRDHLANQSPAIFIKNIDAYMYQKESIKQRRLNLKKLEALSWADYVVITYQITRKEATNG